MTSEVWVWSYLPGDTEPTLAGRFQRTVTPAGQALGSFVYGKSFIANPDHLALEPLHLKVAATKYETVKLGGMFGPLLDAMPDDWGRYCLQVSHGGSLVEEDFLLLTPDDRIGNLAFSASKDERPRTTEFAKLASLNDARSVLRGLELNRPPDPSWEQWQWVNTAMGGARPKLTVEHDGVLWLAKFPAKNDTGLAVAKLELAMLELAVLCGIDAAQGFVHDEDILLVKRFDRVRVAQPAGTTGWRRESYISARSLFHADPLVAAPYANSYARLAHEVARRSESPASDRVALYRRMVFNACISNTDDHERNHGLLAGDEPGKFRLSPAFDLVARLHLTRRREHAMLLGEQGTIATRENLLSDCGHFGLAPRNAALLLDEVSDSVQTHWRSMLDKHGATKAEIDQLRGCFAALPDTVG